MKKKFSLVVCAASLIGLASCGGASNSSKVIDDANNLHDRIVELSNNVSKLPDTEDVFKNTIDDGKNKPMSALITTDLTTPTEDYDVISSYNAYYSITWEKFDSLKNEGIEIKDFTLEHIKEYDRWVNSAYDSYYVSYDQILDEVRLLRVNQFTIVDIKSSYDKAGNSKITVSYYWNDNFTVEGYAYLTSIEYVENEKWTGINLSQDSDSQFCSISEVNLKNNETTEIDYSYVDDMYGKRTNISPVVDYKNGDITYILGNKEDEEYIQAYDLDGHVLYKRRGFFVDGSGSVSIPLYALDGWDKAYTIGDEENPYERKLYVEIGDDVYKSLEGDYYGDNYVTFYLDATGCGMEPYISIDFKDYKDEANVVSKVLEDFGLSYKRDVFDEIMDVSSEVGNILSKREAFGLSSLLHVNEDVFNNVYNRVNRAKLRLNDLNKYKEEISTSGIGIEEQTPSKGIYNYMKFSESGNMTYSDGTLSLNGVSITLEKNALLSKNARYSAKLIIEDADSVREICQSKAASFNGSSDLVLEFESFSFDVSDYIGESDEYTIYIIVTMNDSRITSAIGINADVDYVSRVIDSEELIDGDETYIMLTTYELYNEGLYLKIKINTAIVENAKE